MSDENLDGEAEIILAAYAEKVKEAFMVFAEALNTGQPQKACIERFLRAIGVVRRARDLALEAMRAGDLAEATEARPAEPDPGEGLSEEDRAMIEAALSGTTGVARPTRLR